MRRIPPLAPAVDESRGNRVECIVGDYLMQEGCGVSRDLLVLRSSALGVASDRQIASATRAEHLQTRLREDSVLEETVSPQPPPC